jgi:hypothetical protein
MFVLEIAFNPECPELNLELVKNLDLIDALVPDFCVLYEPASARP